MKFLRLLLFLFICFVIAGCTTISDKEENNVFFQNHRAQWIQDKKPLPQSDSLFYTDDPAPIFRKTFLLKEAPKKVKLHITAAGYYKAFVNGSGLQNNILDPAWTDSRKRIYFREHDITSQVDKGMNCLSVSIGNGFYNPLPLKMWGRINLRARLPVGKPRFISKITITYQEGKTEEIVSDTSWKYSYGPIQRNSVYLGTHYDATKEIEGWKQADFDDTLWENARVATPPGGQLQKAFFPPVKVNRKIKPTQIYALSEGKWMIDMGENFTGTYSIKLRGQRGDKISFRLGERVYDDGSLNPMTAVIGQIKKKGMGGSGAPEIAWQTNSFIIGDENPSSFSPEFTYHAFRFIEIDGLKYRPSKQDITGLSLHTDVDQENYFSSASVLINEIQNTTRRTFLANLVGVQSDCPAREKFGYGGDLNATSTSFIYNFDMQSFYKKTVYDWVDAINDSTFVDTAPNVGIQYCGISWESAFLITQYQRYLYYKDWDGVKELYAFNNRWMDKVARLHPQGIVHSGLSDHESLVPVPVELIGTVHYLQCARIMKKFAELMKDGKRKNKYQHLAKDLERKLREEFWNKKVEGKINRQTLFSALLYHDIIPEDEIAAARDSLKSSLNKAPAQHLTTGIFGTQFALEAISQHLSPQVTFDIVNSKEYPGWGHMIDRGATTLWETWKESDDVYSNSHPMFGSVSAWCYRWLGGIRPDPDYPGFDRFFIRPFTPIGLDRVATAYKSPHGKIISKWEKQENGYRYEISVPKASIAQVSLNKEKHQKIAVIKGGSFLNKDEKEDVKDGEFKLRSGEFIFEISHP